MFFKLKKLQIKWVHVKVTLDFDVKEKAKNFEVNDTLMFKDKS